MTPTIADLIRVTATEFGIAADDIKGASRMAEYCRPRFAVCLLARDMGLSTPRIGLALGDRDHTTVISAIRRAEHWIEQDAEYRERVQAIRKAVVEPPKFYRHGAIVFKSQRPAMAKFYGVSA